jgi:hypothetical protein
MACSGESHSIISSSDVLQPITIKSDDVHYVSWSSSALRAGSRRNSNEQVTQEVDARPSRAVRPLSVTGSRVQRAILGR